MIKAFWLSAAFVAVTMFLAYVFGIKWNDALTNMALGYFLGSVGMALTK